MKMEGEKGDEREREKNKEKVCTSGNHKSEGGGIRKEEKYFDDRVSIEG